MEDDKLLFCVKCNDHIRADECRIVCGERYSSDPSDERLYKMFKCRCGNPVGTEITWRDEF